MKQNTKPSMKTSFQTLKPLFTLCRIIGLWPKATNLKNNKRRLIHPFIAFLFVLLIYVYGTYGKITYISKVVYPTIAIVDFITDGCLTVAVLWSLVLINLVKYKQLDVLLNDFKFVDAQFNCLKLHSKYPCLKLYTELLVVNIVYLIYYIYYSIVWIKSVGWNIFRYFVLREYQFYHLIILAVLLRYFVLSIKFRFEVLNDVLLKLYTARKEGIVFFKDFEAFALKHKRNSLEDREKRWDMTQVKSVYTKLTSIVELFNNIFGFQYVLFYINIVANLIAPINIALIYGDGSRDIHGASFGLELCFLCLVWSGIPLMLAVLLYSSCNQGEEEAAKTISVCYNLIDNLGEGEKDLNFKNELLELIQQANYRKVEFKAAGFFVINFNTLFSLFGSVTAYVIVLVQFIK